MNIPLQAARIALQLQDNNQQPLVVGTLHSAACLKRLQKGPQGLLKKVDLLEARLDCLPSTLPSLTWPLPVLATARCASEGGGRNLTLLQRQQLLEKALPWATAIDVELRSAKKLSSIMMEAKKAKRLVIISFHDFQAVPSLERLERMLFQAQELGADLFKAACFLRHEEDLIRLLAFQLTVQTSTSIATMGMGEGGKLARLLLAAAGSVLTYGWLYSPHVAGQWSVEEWATIRPMLTRLKKMAARTGVEPVRQP